MTSEEQVRKLQKEVRLLNKRYSRLERSKVVLETMWDRNACLFQKLNEDLATANSELIERTQELNKKTTQLIQAEKMASLGNLVAGVAHEINTPLGALKSNTHTIQCKISNIEGLLLELGDTDSKKKFGKLTADIRMLGSVCNEATERISKIVHTLRSFARIDQAVKDTVDIHEGLDSTLSLVQHETKDQITVHTEYGDLPNITCFPDLINQVFMNLMVNAIQAIEDEGEIFIKTYCNQGRVVLEISDTGLGMSKDELEHIFDPGFTTKGVGVGTGLGLSIVYQIVQEHKGKVEVESEPGQGSTFRVFLPAS